MPNIQNYDDCVALAQTRKRKLANNTYLVIRDDGGYGIRLHNTEVVVYYPDRFVLDSGTWQTVTTKERMNRFAPISLWQDKGVWYVNAFTGETVTFADGMTIYNDGRIAGAGPDPKVTQTLRKQVNAFCKAYAQAFINGDIAAPSGGDCWLCLIADPNDSDSSHIVLHMEESYFVPSLLVRAKEHAPGLLSIAAQDYIGRTWSPDHDASDSWPTGIIAPQIISCLKRYMCHRLGLPA